MNLGSMSESLRGSNFVPDYGKTFCYNVKAFCSGSESSEYSNPVKTCAF